MRRSVLSRIALVVAAPAAFAIAGCEDGPNQPYGPAPNGAGSIWNNGGGVTNDPGMQGFNAGGGGTNAVNICTAAQQQAQWSMAFQAPLIPPFGAAGIDLSAKGTFNTVTIEQIEKGLNGNLQLCQGFNGAGFCNDGSGSPGYSWGESNQVNTCYDQATHAVTFFLLLPGYDGEATFTLPAMYKGQPVPWAVAQDGSMGKDLKYVWHIGKPVTENGQVLDMAWAGADGGKTHTKRGVSDAIANKLFLALTYTFNPTLIATTDKAKGLNYMTDPGFNCLPRALCRTSTNPDLSGGNYGARTVALYADFALSNSTDKASAGAPSDIYMYPVKYMPYSFSTYNVGLDQFQSPNPDNWDPNINPPPYGAYTPAGVLSPPGGTQTPYCTLYMGQKWGDFQKACLNVSGDSMTDMTTMNKLLGAQHHAPEWFVFSVNGQNQNFSATAAELAAPNYVLADSEHMPPADSVASDLFNDIRSYGVPLNDSRGDSYPACGVGSSPACKTVDPEAATEDKKMQGQDFHGTAAVMGYYRQLVFDDLRKQLTAFGITPQTLAAIQTGACWTGACPATGVPPSNYVFPDGCTGFEQMVTAGYPLGLADTVWQDAEELGPYPYGLYAPTVFRSGDPVADFMGDPSCGFFDDAYINGVDNLVQGSQLQVQYVVGHGDLSKVPPAARDWRYYLKFWGKAYVSYLLNRSKDPTWHDLYTNTCGGVANGCRQINEDALFFDLNDGLDKFEYIDRTPAVNGNKQPPMDFEYNILIYSSNTQSMNFYQRLTRAESALYQSMLTDKTAVPGSNDNVNVSDLFGAPAMAGIVGGLPPGTTSDAYTCATVLPTPADCPAGPPTDSQGNMLVDGAGKPLFTNYHGLFTGTPYTIGHVLPIKQTLPNVLGAIVSLPNYDNPYDSTTKNNPIDVFVPHLQSQPGVGFEIPINAQRSQFIQTGSLDFSGVTVTFNVDYIPQYDPMTGALTGGKIAAVETQDFLGEVWPCVDATTGDILRVKMYSSSLDILNWFDAHPGSRTACNVFVRMSPYNNWPDYIWSTVNGVLLSINPGAGGGPPRVSDTTLFDPTLLTQTQ